MSKLVILLILCTINGIVFAVAQNKPKYIGVCSFISGGLIGLALAI